jgi:hypothetical protein
VDVTSHALLVESAITAGERHTWFGRAEVVGMPAHDLHAHEFGAQVFTVGKFEAGYVRHLRHWGPLAPGVGGMVSANVVPADLAPRYSGRVAPGFSVFLTLAPRHTM